MNKASFWLAFSLVQFDLILVGARGFEPPTTSPPAKCATRLRYAPKPQIIAEGASLMTDDSRNEYEITPKFFLVVTGYPDAAWQI
jgi:hypothetical protein